MSWEDVKAARAHSPARRRGYEKAWRAIRIAFEVRALRGKNGLSRRELAERVGTTQSAIARLEAATSRPASPRSTRSPTPLGAEVSLTIVDLDELTGAH